MIPLRIIYRATPVWLRWTLLGAVLWTASMVAAVQYGKRVALADLRAAAAENSKETAIEQQEQANEVRNLDDDAFGDAVECVFTGCPR